MKTKQVFWGVFFLSIGVLLLLNNFLTDGLRITGLYEYWPLLLVIAGASIMVKDSKIRLLLSGINGLILALMLYSLIIQPFSFFEWHSDKQIKYSNSTEQNMKFDSTINQVSFDLEAGAGSFAINGDCPDQYTIDGKGNFIVSANQNLDKLDLEVSFDDIHINFNDKSGNQNYVNVALNNTPSYSFDLSLGAATANLNLGQLKLNDFSLKSGATSIDLALGEPYGDSYEASIEMGVGSVYVKVPKDVGVSLDIDMPLSSTDISGFNEIKDGKFETEDFSNAKKKIYLKVDGGLSSFKISQN